MCPRVSARDTGKTTREKNRMQIRLSRRIAAGWMGLAFAAFWSSWIWAQTPAVTPDTSDSLTYIYDGLGRVTAKFYQTNPTGQLYSYDSAGNILSNYSGNVSIASFDTTSLPVQNGVVQINAQEPASGSTGSVVINVVRTGANVLSTVKYQTFDGTAIANTNYTKSSGFLTFSSSVNTQQIKIPILYHQGFDGPLSFTVQLQPVSNNALTPLDTAQVTINDSDPAPVFKISGPSSVTRGNNATFTVTRQNQVNFTQTINYATADASPFASLAYTQTSGTLTFAPTDSSANFNVSTVPLVGYLGLSKFSTSISNPSVAGTFSTQTVTTSIPEPNTPFVISVNAPNVGFPGTCMHVSALLSGTPAAVPVQMSFDIESGDPNMTYPYPSVGAAVAGFDFPIGYNNTYYNKGNIVIPAGISPVGVELVTGNPGCLSGGLSISAPVVEPGVTNFSTTLTFSPNTPYSSMSQVVGYPAMKHQPNELAPTLNPALGLLNNWIGQETRTMGQSFSLGVQPPPIAPGSSPWNHYEFWQTDGSSGKIGSAPLCSAPSASPSCTFLPSVVGPNGITAQVRACSGSASSTCGDFSQPTNLSIVDSNGN